MKFGNFTIWLFRPLIRLVFPYRVIGIENIPPANPDSRLILCANHISLLDPVYLEVGLPRHVYFMAKAELFKNPILRWLIEKQYGAFPVKRGAGDTGALDTAGAIVREGKMLGIFPEGTRSKDGKLGRAKSGASLIAAQTHADILPVCIIAKGQHARAFHCTKIVIGKPLTNEELHLESPEHPDLRYSSRLLMERIGQMMAEHS